MLFKKIMTDCNLSLPPLPSQECHLVIHILLPLRQDDNHFRWGSDSLRKQKRRKAKSSSDNLDTHLLHLDLGVINLTGSKDADETTKAEPLKVSQKWKRDGNGNGWEAKSLKASQRQRSDTCKRGSDKDGPSKVPQKQQKTHNS